jgi:transposase
MRLSQKSSASFFISRGCSKCNRFFKIRFLLLWLIVRYLVILSMTTPRKIPFKPYSPKQAMLLPPSLDEMVPANHPVRVVDRVIDQIDIQPLIKTYKGGGSSGYHPRMLLKVLIYSYLRNVYSSRQMEDSLKENIYFMWLSGMNMPDHNTINRFRGKRLEGQLKDIFSSVVILLAGEGHLSIKEVFVDGTKIEANANRYTFVWGKAIPTQVNKIKNQLESLWAYAQNVYNTELQEPETPDFTEISAEKVEETIRQINQALKGKEVDKEVKKKLEYGSRHWPENLRKYQTQKEILEERNSFSKTDHDATFMRTKEDHMKNGQLKPCYNWQFSTNNQFVVNYTVTQTTTDTTTLIEHLESYNHQYDSYPETATADSGYGSEENYQYLDDNGIEGFVKFNYFHLEQTRKFKEDIFRRENHYYNPEQDCFYCPMGQKMQNIGEGKRVTSTGFEQKVSYYKAQNCQGCPLRWGCHKAKGERIIEVNHNLERYKQKARELLLSPEGVEHRKQRPADVEATFGNIKQNKGFRRFMLRGKHKVEIETGLIAIAHNLSKIRA